MDTIGKRILLLRKISGLTQTQLAAATGLQRGNLSHYEKDKIKPAAEALIALSTFFNVSADWLLTGEEKAKGADLPGILSQEEKAELERYAEFLLWRREQERDRDKKIYAYLAENMQEFGSKREKEVLLPLIGNTAGGLAGGKLIEGVLPVPLVLAGDNSFLFRVGADALQEAGIDPGDLAVIRLQDFAARGDIALLREGQELFLRILDSDQPRGRAGKAGIVGKVTGKIKKTILT